MDLLPLFAVAGASFAAVNGGTAANPAESASRCQSADAARTGPGPIKMVAGAGTY